MQALLKKLQRSNIKIDLIDEKLDIQSPKGVMTEDLLNEIRLHKDELIEFITLNKIKRDKQPSISKIPEQPNYVLSSSQRRLWLLSQFDGGNIAYTIPTVFELEGNVILSSLEKSFFTLIERHESLRTLFRTDETDEVRQVILDPSELKFQLRYEDISGEENLPEKVKTIIQHEAKFPFDLSSDSLLRSKIVRTSKDTYLFICVLHHIISDGWSIEIMMNELFTLYDSFTKGTKNQIPPLL
jgi:hypothetical protein